MNAKVANIKTPAKTERVESDLGEGIHAVVEGNILTMTIDLSKDFGKSASGKSTIIATSKGNVQIPGAANGAKMGLNIYR